MAALRWILLGLGVLFLVALAAWELRRQRHAATRGDQAPASPVDRPDRSERPERGERAPTASAAPASTRVRTPVPPRVDLPPLEPEIAFQPIDAPLTLPTRLDARIEADFDVDFNADIGPARPDTAAHPLPAMLDVPLPADRPVQLHWPPDADRHVIALRIVPAGEEPLAGRQVRQSLGACGFVHGPLQIYHQPAEDGRALLSAASLRKPGTLDPATMDFQRFAGLSLFTVLPGPLEPPAALDLLLHTARDLTQRLHARLQDEQGAPLDAARVESLRRTVQGLAGPRPRAEPAA